MPPSVPGKISGGNVRVRTPFWPPFWLLSIAAGTSRAVKCLSTWRIDGNGTTTFRDNEVRLQLFALAYNLGNFLRRLVLPGSVKEWSLTTLREKLIKIGAKVVRHARWVTFQMAEVAVPRDLFERILARISRLPAAPT